MISRILKPSMGASFFLFGPRGVGKTKFLRQTYPEALYVDLLADDTFNDLISSTQRLEKRILQSGKNLVIIDEIQKIPRILDEVHRLIEDRGTRFILTGSSARKLKKQGINLLAGRAHTLYMYPFTAQELGDKFNLIRALNYGLLPKAYLDLDPKAFLSSYITTYLKEEIQQEGITRNLGAFSRFLEAASFSQAQVLSISDISRQASVERKTVEQYFIVLEDLLLATRLPIFKKRASREMSQHPKFFFFDAGVYRALRPKGPLDTPEEVDGAALETLLFQEVRALNSYCNLGYDLFFWRTKQKVEIDLVLYGERGIVGFEVKRSAVLRGEDLNGLKLFLADYPQARGFVLYGGERRYREDGIDVIPFEEGIRELGKLI